MTARAWLSERASASGVSPSTMTDAWWSPMTKRLETRSSRPAICEVARSRAEVIWFCFRSITARADALDRKVKLWLQTKGKRAARRPSQSPGCVEAGYYLMPRTAPKRASAAPRISNASRPKITRST